MSKIIKTTDKEYKIDYEMFSAFEIIKIIEFFSLIEDIKKRRMNKENKELIIEKYHEYQGIIRSKAIEKQYDKMLYEKSGISIYRVIQSITNNR